MSDQPAASSQPQPDSAAAERRRAFVRRLATAAVTPAVIASVLGHARPSRAE